MDVCRHAINESDVTAVGRDRNWKSSVRFLDEIPHTFQNRFFMLSISRFGENEVNMKLKH